jgi:hypothetical protein
LAFLMVAPRIRTHSRCGSQQRVLARRYCTGLKRGNNLAKGDYYQSTAVGVADSFAHSLEPNSRDRLSGPEIFLGKVAGV